MSRVTAIVVGLGKTAGVITKNDMGAIVLGAIAEEHGFPPFAENVGALVSEKDGVVLARPIGVRSTCGAVVAALSAFYKVPPKGIQLLHGPDDVSFQIVAKELKSREFHDNTVQAARDDADGIAAIVLDVMAKTGEA